MALVKVVVVVDDMKGSSATTSTGKQCYHLPTEERDARYTTRNN